MLNTVIIMGRLTRDPEKRTTQSGVSVASFTLAVDRDYSGAEEKQTDFIDCTAWRHSAEFVTKYFAKGSMAIVKGRLQIDNYTDNDGNKRKSAKVIADNIYFGESKKSGGQNSHQNGEEIAPASAGFVPVEVDDSELPF